MSKAIYPTGSCFTDSLELFCELLRKQGRHARLDLRLVHAICTFADGREYSHAWVEDIKDHEAIFIGILDGVRGTFAAPAEEYRLAAGCKESTEYPWSSVYLLNHSSGHYGPWDDKYRRLCKENINTLPSEGVRQVHPSTPISPPEE